jgi:hypothetical protein
LFVAPARLLVELEMAEPGVEMRWWWCFGGDEVEVV